MTNIRSEQFNDIYFSPDNGLEESRYVFIDANNLPQKISMGKDLTIVECGFGTGLNFLCACECFEKNRQAGQWLDFISFEKYPLRADQILETLSPWASMFEGKLQALVDSYPMRIPGFHRVYFSSNIRLTLVFDDINLALPELIVPGGVDCWFLDGFAPSKNPEMWTDIMYDELRRLSKHNATFSTFTAAGHVRRALSQRGFSVDKVKGYGRKREMLQGRFKGNSDFVLPGAARNVAIIGGGLAGAAAAYFLHQNGIKATIFEKEISLARGASGNPLGLFNPRLSAYRTEQSDYYNAGFSLINNIDPAKVSGREQCGALHLFTDKGRTEKLEKAATNWGWQDELMTLVDRESASDIAGVSLDQGGVWLKSSGCINPAQLSRNLARHADLITSSKVTELDALDADVMIIANSYAAGEFPQTAWIPTEGIKGQISFGRSNEDSASLKTNICYGGYISPAFYEGQHVIGATFEKEELDLELSEQGHQRNLDLLHYNLQALSGLKNIAGGRASVRCASRDRFPVAGKLPDVESWMKGYDCPLKNVYVSMAHGSHGLVSSLSAGSLLADMISGRPYGLPDKTINALDASRFLLRARKRGTL
jgi:tRNA 5-methylaminomethyl-2-thiouridine biosynthesis bifunctional protein